MVVGEDLQLKSSVRLSLNIVGGLLRLHIHRMSNGQIVGIFVCELGCSAPADARCNCKRPCSCPGHQSSARYPTHGGPRYWIVLFVNVPTVGREMQAG